MLSRRTFLHSLAAARRRPNFILLLTDDQRFDTISALGNRELRTPNIDRLVRNGVAFTHCQTQGGLTGAICMPSRAQILTGRSVFEVHRAIVDHQDSPDPAVLTFPEHLRAAGYQTFHTGKWHNGPKLFARSFTGGANIFFGGMTDQLKVPVQDFDPTGQYGKQRQRIENHFSSELFAGSAVDFLKQRDPARPFHLNVCFTSPHDPRMAPTRFSSQYTPAAVTLPKNFLPVHPFDNGEMKVRDELLAPFPRTPEIVRQHLAAYYAMVAEVDSNIGRVLDALDATGEAENTYIVYAGDNGLAVGQHGLLGKQNLYDHSLRVPLVLTGPGLAKGKRDHSPRHLMDIAPTICELAGSSLSSATQGASLLKPPPRRATIAAYRDLQRSIRTDRYKLILYNVNGARTTQLFDLDSDPLEMHNLAADPSRAPLINSLCTQLATELKQAGDTNPIPCLT